MATLPGGGPAEDGSELRSHACGVAKVETGGRVPGVDRIVVVTPRPRGTPATAGGEHRRAARHTADRPSLGVSATGARESADLRFQGCRELASS